MSVVATTADRNSISLVMRKTVAMRLIAMLTVLTAVHVAGCQSALNNSSSKVYDPQCNWRSTEAGLCRGGHRYPG
jgi:hypothetical protein